MVDATKIDSNITGLSYAEEESFKVLPVTPIWIPLEPNTYNDFGGAITTVARNPINASRQRKKGVVTDLDASGGFDTDFTQTNMQDLLQGFFFADLRRKGEELITSLTVGGTDTLAMADTTGFQVGDFVQTQNMLTDTNNLVAQIVTVNTNVSLEFAGSTFTAETTPADAQVVNVATRAASGDLDVVVSGSLPVIFSNGTLDFTTLGLIPGEWIFVGGDLAANQFVNAANNGFKRIRSITATELTLDKSDLTMVVETGTGLLIDLYVGRVLKNELGTLIVRRTYNLERTLGAPDTALPAEIQSEYLTGAVPNEFTFNIPTADKLTSSLTFVAADSEQRTGATGVKSGTRQALVESDALNTSSDFSRIRLAQVVAGDEAPAALFAFAQELTISINNNVVPNKAVSVLGSFEVTAGTFEVGGSITAYFADVAAVSAVRNNVDITIDMAMSKDNTGLVLDLPLLSLGDARPNVEQDQPITLPLEMDAATAALIDSTLDYTALMVFFDYLPDAADV